MLTNQTSMADGIVICPICEIPVSNKALKIKDHSISGEIFSIIPCQSCGLQITTPQPGPDEIGRYYASEDYISHSNSKKGLINSLYHRIRNYMLNQKASWVKGFAGKSTGKILDMGAGTGYFAAKMKSVGWIVDAVEPDDQARQNAKKEHNIDIISPDSLSTLRKGEYDVITLWHVLEHIHDLNGQLKLYHELLKPGGSLIIAVPNYTSNDAKHYKENWAAYDVPRHLWHFSPNAMKKLLTKHRFDLTKMKTMPMDAFYVSMLSEKYNGNKSGGLVNGGIQGTLTYIKSLTNTEKASSLIYFSKRI